MDTKKLSEVFLLPNGNAACFTSKGCQIPELQKNGWFYYYLSYLATQGVDIENVEFRLIPSVHQRILKVNKAEEGLWIISNENLELKSKE